jgi:transcriptional regulator with XRE-family HTH domain
MAGLGKRLKARRTERGLSQQTLANHLRTTRQTIANWEQDKHEPTLDEIRGLAALLGTRAEWLAFNGPTEPGPPAASEIPNLSVVPELDVRAAAGGGQMAETEQEHAQWGFPADWLRFELRTRSANLRIITIEGDSMLAPDGRGIHPGDKVVVDTERKSPSPPGPFILWDGFGLVAKRLHLIPNSDPPAVTILSDNPSYAAYERTLDEVNIVGRIVGRWERL